MLHLFLNCLPGLVSFGHLFLLMSHVKQVFDSARARERERELLYPDACGGGGRGWISQGMGGYGRGHGTRETCALHTARLSVDTLVDFWSALGEETRLSLLRMKEEDFIERLMYRSVLRFLVKLFWFLVKLFWFLLQHELTNPTRISMLSRKVVYSVVEIY